MFRVAEVLHGHEDAGFWTRLKQIGVDDVVSRLPGHSGELDAVRAHVQRYRDAGLRVCVVEDTTPMESIRTASESRDLDIARFCELLQTMGALGLPVLCYNWMAVEAVLRTSVDTPGRGGALVTSYDHVISEQAPHPKHDLTHERLWENLEYFLRRVIPFAEGAGVKLAMHPDDPPRSSVRGIPRIMCDVNGFERLVGLLPSECNGITLCQGNFTLMTDDLPSVIRRLGKHIHFVHCRDVRGDLDHYEETFHDEGRTDMLGCMRAYRDIGFDGVMRSDHVPTMLGDTNEVPGYSTIGRLFAIGYMAGLREAAYTS